MTAVGTWAGGLIVTIVLASVAEMLVSETYVRYLRFAVGLALILLLTSPIVTFMGREMPNVSEVADKVEYNAELHNIYNRVGRVYGEQVATRICTVYGFEKCEVVLNTDNGYTVRAMKVYGGTYEGYARLLSDTGLPSGVITWIDHKNNDVGEE